MTDEERRDYQPLLEELERIVSRNQYKQPNPWVQYSAYVIFGLSIVFTVYSLITDMGYRVSTIEKKQIEQELRLNKNTAHRAASDIFVAGITPLIDRTRKHLDEMEPLRKKIDDRLTVLEIVVEAKHGRLSK